MRHGISTANTHREIRVFIAAALLLPWLGGCAVIAVGGAIAGVGAAAVSVVATTVKAGAKAAGAVVDAVTPDGAETAKK